MSSIIVDEIKELLHSSPLQPVRIVLGDRQSFIVPHADYFMTSPDRQTVVLYDADGRFRIINAQQIKLVEPVRRPRSGRTG